MIGQLGIEFSGRGCVAIDRGGRGGCPAPRGPDELSAGEHRARRRRGHEQTVVSGAGALATLGAELDDLGVERIFLVAGARAGSSVAAAETKDNLGARGIEADLAKVCTSVVAEGPAPNPRPLTRPALEALLTAAWSGDLSGAASR